MRGQVDQRELQLAELVASCYYRPLRFVLAIFPWEKPRTFLENEEGPDTWQSAILVFLGKRCREVGAAKATGEAIRIAVASGHGIGKTTLIAWIILWFISTRPHPQIVVTANTKVQLETKTWRELAKWHGVSRNKHWHDWTATRFYNVKNRGTWFAVAQPWSKERSEAFAGTHEKHVIIIYDEASLIDDIIWEVTEGAMTTEGAIWIAFGNPTRNTGRFKACFKKFRHRWFNRQIDSRTAKKANQHQIQQWIEDYGEDSDFVRVRVRGVFPRASSMQLISEETAEAAAKRNHHPSEYIWAPKILGVDPARYGDDMSTWIIRQGVAAYGLAKHRGSGDHWTMTFADLIAQEIVQAQKDNEPFDAVFIDEIGIGAGVVDRLRQLGHDVIGLNSQTDAIDSKRFFNRRMEMWWKMKDWLKEGSMPNDQQLIDDLIGPEYGYTGKGGKMQLEKKEDTKARGLASPDCADALAHTLCAPVTKRDDASLHNPHIHAHTNRRTKNDYDRFRHAQRS